MIIFNPSVRILLYILLIVAVFIYDSFRFYGLLLAITMLFAFRTPLSVFKRGLIPITVFLLFTFISNVFFHSGGKVHELLGLTITEDGLIQGGRLAMRLLILIVGAKILTASTRAEELVHGMSRLLGPFGRIGYVQELICTMSLTLRLIPIIYDEAMEVYKKVRKSQGTAFSDKMKLAVTLLTALFDKSMERAREMSGNGEETMDSSK